MTVERRELAAAGNIEVAYLSKKAWARRGYLVMDLIKVTIKTAEININPPAATRPRETKKMVPALAGGPHSLLAHTKAKSEAKKVRRIRIIPPGRSRIWMAAFSTVYAMRPLVGYPVSRTLSSARRNSG